MSINYTSKRPVLSTSSNLLFILFMSIDPEGPMIQQVNVDPEGPMTQQVSTASNLQHS